MPDSVDGNSTQIRALAQTLFDTWKTEAELKERRRVLAGSIPAWVACALSIGLLVWNAAVISGNVTDNTRRISQLESDKRENETDTRGLIDRLARIEAKVDIVVGEKK